MTKRLTSDERQVVRSQIRSPFEDSNDPTVAKAFVGTIFVKVEPTLFFVVKEVEVLLGKVLLDVPLVFASSESGRAVDAEAIGIDL